MTDPAPDRRLEAAAQSFHDAPHPRGNWVHRAEGDLPRSLDSTPEKMRANPYAFVVVRDPVDRFLSLYFDKVMRPRKVGDGRLRRTLLEEGAIDPAATSVESHRRNCLATIDWIARNLSGKTVQETNKHWTRQIAVLRQVAPLHPKVLTLNGLTPQLRYLLSGRVPDIQRHLDGAMWRNRSQRPAFAGDLCDSDLMGAVLKVYARDAGVWADADTRWKSIDQGLPDLAKIPTLGKDVDIDP